MIVRGTATRITALTVVMAVLVVILGFILSLVPSKDGDLLTSIWNTLLCSLDGGTIAGIESNDGQKVVLLITTLFGIIFSSVLVGVITTGIEANLDEYAHEGSKVLELRPHLLVLGCTPMTGEVLRSIAQKNERGHRLEPVVVLTGSRDVMEVGAELDAVLRDYHKTKTIYRQGCTYGEADLNLCSIESAHTILVTVPSDDEAVKTVLVCTALLKELELDTPVYVVCENKEELSRALGEDDGLIRPINPENLLMGALKQMQEVHPATQTMVAGGAVNVSDQTNRLLIAANEDVSREESDNLVIRSLLELRPLCERRRAEGKPLEIGCMLFFERNVDPARRAGADETVLVGHLLAEGVSLLVSEA